MCQKVVCVCRTGGDVQLGKDSVQVRLRVLHQVLSHLRHTSNPGDPDSFTPFRPYIAHFPPVFPRFLRVFTVSTARFQPAASRNPGPRDSWLISSHNLTICDVGAGTEQMLYKGQLLPRPSTQACDFGGLE